jgi:flagellar basal-body rod protein FlgG
MLRAFSTAATGMTAQQMVVDTIANNLANINTSGFKRSQVDFQDLVYVKLQTPGAEVASGIESPTGFELGNGVRPGSTQRIFTQGEMDNTGHDLDVAIEGDGFFQVATPGGKTQYTRDGALRINSQGNLVTSSGYLLEPNITIPSDCRGITIGTDGTVGVLTGSNTSPSSIGTLTMVRFSNPSGLSGEGGNLMSETAASGPPLTGTAGQNGFGTFRQGFLEKSNVQMVTELVNLITAQRAYETNSRAIQAGDSMLTTANRLIS